MPASYRFIHAPLLLMMIGSPALAQTTAASPEVVQHIQAAITIAGNDPVLSKDINGLCPNLTRPFTPASTADPVINYTPTPPTRVFDNLYSIGIVSVGSWALKTSDGIILIDTNYNNRAVEEVLLPGMKKLGLDPAQIKYAIITHSHGDHFGGAQYLKEHYGTRIVMSDLDWQVVSKPTFYPSGNPDPAPRPLRDAQDITITDRGTLTLGDTTVTLMVTPGHTVGTMSMIFPFKYQGKTYNGMMWGAGNMTQFLPPLERFVNEVAKPAKPVARFSSHLTPETRENLEQINKNPDAPDPFFYGAERFSRYLEIAVECSKASVARSKSAS